MHVVYLLSVLFLLGVLGTGFSFMSVLAKLGLEHSTYSKYIPCTFQYKSMA